MALRLVFRHDQLAIGSLIRHKGILGIILLGMMVAGFANRTRY